MQEHPRLQHTGVSRPRPLLSSEVQGQATSQVRMSWDLPSQVKNLKSVIDVKHNSEGEDPPSSETEVSEILSAGAQTFKRVASLSAVPALNPPRQLASRDPISRSLSATFASLAPPLRRDTSWSAHPTTLCPSTDLWLPPRAVSPQPVHSNRAGAALRMDDVFSEAQEERPASSSRSQTSMGPRSQQVSQTRPPVYMNSTEFVRSISAGSRTGRVSTGDQASSQTHTQRDPQPSSSHVEQVQAPPHHSHLTRRAGDEEGPDHHRTPNRERKVGKRGRMSK
jgi:hypothetical protein